MMINKEFFKKITIRQWSVLAGVVIIISLLIVRFLSGGKLGGIFQQQPGTVYLSLTPASQSISSQSPFTLDVNLDTGNSSTIAVDVAISFDQTKLTLTDILENTAGSFKTFAPIKTQTTVEFDKQRVITDANQDGVLEFGALNVDMSSLQPPFDQFQGATSLATLTFQVNSSSAAGQETIDFIYNQNATDDSNVVAFDAQNQPQDVLQAVESAVVNISTSDNVCQHDYDDNKSIGVGDLLHLLNSWDSAGISKLLAILANWGTDCS